MLQSIKVKVNSLEKEILVYDAAYLLINKKLQPKDFRKALEILHDEQNNICYQLLIPADKSGALIDVYSSNKELTISAEEYWEGLKDQIVATTFLKEEEPKEIMNYFDSEERQVKVRHYYGKCP